MTKSTEKGENEITRAAKLEAARTGKGLDAILREMLAAAMKAKDADLRRKIEQAQKYFWFRKEILLVSK